MKLILLLLTAAASTNAFVSQKTRRSLTRLCSETEKPSTEKKSSEGDDAGMDFIAKGFEAADKGELDMFRIYGDRPERFLKDLIQSMLYGSDMIYSYTFLRNYVNSTRNELEWWRPQLILTQEAADFANEVGFRRLLRHPVTADAMYMFVTHKRNWKFLQDKIKIHKAIGEEMVTGPREPDNVKTVLKKLIQIGGHIVEFDDKFQGSELVYAIFANFSSKRITVLFRGSIKNTNDWSTNFRLWFTEKLQKPEQIKDVPIRWDDDIKVHSGFHNCLFEETEDKTRKFDDIVGHIKSLYAIPAYMDYDLFVCGHSLGAALASYLAYNLAGSDEIMNSIPGPVTAITFGSPQVGNAGYNEAFEALERKGNLRHIRISNEDDAVTVFPMGFGYTQTGLNFHLYPSKAMEIGHRNLKRSLSQFRFDAKIMDSAHELGQYNETLFGVEENVEILESKTVGDLYREYFNKEDGPLP